MGGEFVMSNISGNFDTGSREERIVAYYLRLNKEKDFTVSKFGEAIDSKKAKPIMTNAVSSGDIYVTFPDKRYCLIEVKEESESRFLKYGEYGIDMISMFHFKKGVDRKKWIRPHKGVEAFKEFLNDIDQSDAYLKLGKLGYSYADIWLFFTSDSRNKVTHIAGYDARKIMQDGSFFDYLVRNCPFTANSKNDSQMSNADTWESAVFFVKPEILSEFKIEDEHIIKHGILDLTKYC